MARLRRAAAVVLMIIGIRGAVEDAIGWFEWLRFAQGFAIGNWPIVLIAAGSLLLTVDLWWPRKEPERAAPGSSSREELARARFISEVGKPVDAAQIADEIRAAGAVLTGYLRDRADGASGVAASCQRVRARMTGASDEVKFVEGSRRYHRETVTAYREQHREHFYALLVRAGKVHGMAVSDSELAPLWKARSVPEIWAAVRTAGLIRRRLEALVRQEEA